MRRSIATVTTVDAAWLCLALLTASGCATEASSSPSPSSPVHRFDPDAQYGTACTPRGDVQVLQGELVVRPFGKGTDGAVLQVSRDETWILSYRATGVLLELEGRRVEITGRACDKFGEAIYGDHFALETLQELAR